MQNACNDFRQVTIMKENYLSSKDNNNPVLFFCIRTLPFYHIPLKVEVKYIMSPLTKSASLYKTGMPTNKQTNPLFTLIFFHKLEISQEYK